jgi:signal transduction histidine kinase
MPSLASNVNNFPNQAQETAPASAIEARPRLVLRFALYAGAVLLAAGLAIAWLVNRQVADRAQRTVENQTHAAVVENLRSHLRPADFAGPVSARRRATLDVLFRKSILLPGVVGGRLIGRDGTLTYAARHELIGTRVERGELAHLLAGSPSRRVDRVTTWRGERDLKVLRVSVPVELRGRSRALGAVELEQDYRTVAVGVGDAQRQLALILAVALLALYAALFPILRRTTRQLEAHNRHLHEHAEERGRLLASERAARAEGEAAQRLLVEQNAQLRELDALKDEFVSLVSHELRTPLTSIRGYVELLLDEQGLDAEQRRFLAIVDRNSARLLELVADLLFLAQADAGKLRFELAPVDLETLVSACVESSLPTAAAKGIQLTFRAEELPTLQGDSARLMQVLDNLLSNALKFTPARGRVDVRLYASDERAVLEVEDTGLGLAQDEQERLFERFFRSSRATENAIPGTGLGLAIAKTIIERHGGGIAVESAVDRGTTVRVELPLSGRSAGRSTHELAA